jgi:hypothetical protein
MLNPVRIRMEKEEGVRDGEFNIRQPLLEQGKFNDWLLCCSNGTDKNKLFNFVENLKKAAQDLNIKLKDPS